VHTLSAERDLVAAPLASRHASGSNLRFLALADPDFDATGTAPAAGAPSQVVFRGARSECASFETLRFGPLPVSAQEVEAIRSLWPDSRATAVYTKGEANEANFKVNAPAAETIHLATHGFFLGAGSAIEDTGPTQRGVGGLRPSAAAPICADPNPLLLSGLALAGANARAGAKDDAEDGVLTAEEIAALDLSQTRWAVLSACDTGLGDVRAGEGVMGLRRAFQAAGARTLIMSLWAVEDEAARAWMTSLYTARLRDDRSTAEAVRFATRGALERSRRAGNAHPFFWAAFVAAGDWR
jgi:CHAT domain-containing protein